MPPTAADLERQSHEKRVAILGFAESYKSAPFDDPGCEIWGLNELYKYINRWDRWWEIHDAETLGMTKRDLTEGEMKRHLEWLRVDHGPSANGTPKPIYMQPAFCDGRFPNAAAYPLDQMTEIFGRYFTSTIGYMLALAIAEDYTWIGMYGVDLVSDADEYENQRPNTEYLLGIARGQNRTLVIPDTSALLKSSHLYGYEQPPSDASGIMPALRQHKQSLIIQREKNIAEMNTLDGAIQECDNIEKVFIYKDRGLKVETF